MWPTIARLAAASSPKHTPTPFNIHRNPYKAKHLWPPDFAKLSPKHQFRLERRYRRRAKLRYSRETWIKGVKLAQYGSMLFVLVYGVLFMDWGQQSTPFQGVRNWYHQKVSSFWTPRTNESS